MKSFNKRSKSKKCCRSSRLVEHFDLIPSSVIEESTCLLVEIHKLVLVKPHYGKMFKPHKN